MKKALACLLFFLCCTQAFAQHKKNSLVGKWEGAVDKAKFEVLVQDNSTLVMSAGGQKTAPCNYVADFSKNPINIDITIQQPGQNKFLLKGMLQFIDANTIQWQVFPDGNRPATFSKAPTLVVLKRVK